MTPTRTDRRCIGQRQRQGRARPANQSRRTPYRSGFEPLAQKAWSRRSSLDEAPHRAARSQRLARSALDRVRAEPEALAAPSLASSRKSTPSPGRWRSRSAILFQIMEPTRLCGRSAELRYLDRRPDRDRRRRARGALLPAGISGRRLRPIRNQAVPVHFRIDGEHQRAACRPVRHRAVRDLRQKEGIAVPRASVVRSQNGQDLVFEHAQPSGSNRAQCGSSRSTATGCWSSPA